MVTALALGMVAAIAHGQDQLAIQLHPQELGRVDVALRVNETGQIHAAFAVERPETLQLLQREARSLEQALTGSGVDLAQAGLSFSLRQDGGQGDGSARTPATPLSPSQPQGEVRRSAEPVVPTRSLRLLDLSV